MNYNAYFTEADDVQDNVNVVDRHVYGIGRHGGEDRYATYTGGYTDGDDDNYTDEWNESTGETTPVHQQHRHQEAPFREVMLVTPSASAEVRPSTDDAERSRPEAQPPGGAEGEPEDDDRTLDGGDHYEEEYEPTEAEMLDYCEWLGVDPVADRPLMWIVREALKAPLPENWRLCYTEDRELYYFNIQTGESIWDHPMDAFYKALYKQEKAKLLKKRQCMRQYSGALELQPLQTFFSELGDEEGVSDDDAALPTPPPGSITMPRHAPWATIPESLVDAIDFRLFIDPVVLPTSGRTVSRHTIINNRWRDPFTREYIENRRLVPNVDKRAEMDAWLGKSIDHFFDALEVSAAGLRRALRILPFLLDKEEEMCLRGQTKFFAYVQRRATPVVVAPSRSETTAASGVASSAASKKGSAVPAVTKRTIPPLRGKTTTQSDNVGASTHSVVRPEGAAASVIDLIGTLDVDAQGGLLAALLTMSTSTSRECLLYILNSRPQLALHAALRGFSDDVLHVLHLSPTDVLRNAHIIARQVAKQVEQATGNGAAYEPPAAQGDLWSFHPWVNSGPDLVGSTPRAAGPHDGSLATSPLAPNAAQSASSSAMDSTSSRAARNKNASSSYLTPQLDFVSKDSDVVAALTWIAAIMDRFQVAVNPLHRLDFVALLHTVFCMEASLAGSVSANCLTRVMQTSLGWPDKLALCPDGVLARLFRIALRDEMLFNRIRTLFDIAWFSGERALEALRSDEARETLVASLLECGASLAEVPASDSKDALQPAEQLGAILVYHDVLSLDALAAQPLLALRIAYNLLPRLTRSQWRPKHFDATISRIIELVQQSPMTAWRTISSNGSIFLLRELCKKKRNSEESRVRLAQLEAGERRLEQSNAINNWGLLAAQLLKRTHEEVLAGAASAKKQKQRDVDVELTAPSSARIKLPSVPGAAHPKISPRDQMGRTGQSGATRGPTLKTGNSIGTRQQAPTHRSAADVTPHPQVTLLRVRDLVHKFADAFLRFSQKREELRSERAASITQALQTLLMMRMKPKVSNRVDVVRAIGSSLKIGGGGDDSAVADQAPVPPSTSLQSYRRVSTTALHPPPSQARHAVSSSCPALPPISSL